MITPKSVRQFDSSTVRPFQEGSAGGTAEPPNRRTAEQGSVASLAARAATARALALALAPPRGAPFFFLGGWSARKGAGRGRPPGGGPGAARRRRGRGPRRRRGRGPGGG